MSLKGANQRIIKILFPNCLLTPQSDIHRGCQPITAVGANELNVPAKTIRDICNSSPKWAIYSTKPWTVLVTHLGTSITKCRGDGWIHSFADRWNCLFLYKFKVKIGVTLLKYPFANFYGTDSKVIYIPGYKNSRRWQKLAAILNLNH